ncbi:MULTISPECIES: hypothetical protein [unclassified Amycolatopsis]|uniref:hypothetical protein n=1 Tax=unclassified Amycolatopsis TaxID=2618356 RepID=UPI002E0E8F33|nr:MULTISPECIES: hypothetical protein [unclassified Amycolatopsis]WSJ73857.1 hypothetical protein OG439_30870 [Amycolatopsis sp. NBC_01307]WSK82486.1 hypothetical protein OG570_18785 [Amycolatopsis sp. NBC_01286]
MKLSPAPREVRLAGVVTGVPSLALLVFGVIVLVNGLGTPARPGNNVYVEAGTFIVVALAFLAASAGLVLGQTWARSPGVVIALIVVGLGWYLLGPSGEPVWGVPIALFGIVTLVLLFRRPSREWALGLREGESETEAAERGGLAGRRAEREGQDED